MNQVPRVFNRLAVRHHRDRSAFAASGSDFLFREAAWRLLDRLDDIKRTFPDALDLGCRDGLLASMLDGRGGIENLVQCDLSPILAGRAASLAPALAADEEFIPFRDASFDLILGSMSLHWVNDLPGALVQLRKALKPGGLLLAVMPGGDSLRELRSSLLAAEMEVEGGASPRVSPMADIRDLGDLLLRAGFVEPVADTESLTVSYADPLKLMHDLRNMGEANSAQARRAGFSRRATIMAAVRRYMEDHAGPDGRIAATFQLIFLAGWVSD